MIPLSRLTVALGGALLLAACGGDSGPANRTAADEALARVDAATANAQARVDGPRPKATPIAAAKDGRSTIREAYDKGFTEKFAPAFIESCKRGAASSGLPAAKIEEVCKCSADDLQAKFTPAQLTSLDPKQADPSMEMCARKAGLSKR